MRVVVRILIALLLMAVGGICLFFAIAASINVAASGERVLLVVAIPVGILGVYFVYEGLMELIG